MKGKNYANRKPESQRPLNDFYPTPSCMVKALIESDFFPQDRKIKIFDPCCGKYAIGKVLYKYGYENVKESDIIYGQDFLKMEIPDRPIYDIIIMNPPFKLFDQFVEQAKYFADKIYVIGKLNFFGAHNRNVNCLWKRLMWVLPFDRQIAFDKPETEDGKVECGMMITGWFIWSKKYEGFPMIDVLDMQKYIVKKSYNKLEDKND